MSAHGQAPAEQLNDNQALHFGTSPQPQGQPQFSQPAWSAPPQGAGFHQRPFMGHPGYVNPDLGGMHAHQTGYAFSPEPSIPYGNYSTQSTMTASAPTYTPRGLIREVIQAAPMYMPSAEQQQYYMQQGFEPQPAQFGPGPSFQSLPGERQGMWSPTVYRSHTPFPDQSGPTQEPNAMGLNPQGDFTRLQEQNLHGNSLFTTQFQDAENLHGNLLFTTQFQDAGVYNMSAGDRVSFASETFSSPGQHEPQTSGNAAGSSSAGNSDNASSAPTEPETKPSAKPSAGEAHADNVIIAGRRLFEELVATDGGFMFDEVYETNAVLSITMLIPFTALVSDKSHWVKKCSTVSEFLALLAKDESKKQILNDLSVALKTESGRKLRSIIRATVNDLRADHQSIPMIIAIAAVLLHISKEESFTACLELKQFCELYAWYTEDEIYTARERALSNGSYDQTRIMSIEMSGCSIWQSPQLARLGVVDSLYLQRWVHMFETSLDIICHDNEEVDQTEDLKAEFLIPNKDDRDHKFAQQPGERLSKFLCKFTKQVKLINTSAKREGHKQSPLTDTQLSRNLAYAIDPRLRRSIQNGLTDNLWGLADTAGMTPDELRYANRDVDKLDYGHLVRLSTALEVNLKIRDKKVGSPSRNARTKQSQKDKLDAAKSAVAKKETLSQAATKKNLQDVVVGVTRRDESKPETFVEKMQAENDGFVNDGSVYIKRNTIWLAPARKHAHKVCTGCKREHYMDEMCGTDGTAFHSLCQPDMIEDLKKLSKGGRLRLLVQARQHDAGFTKVFLSKATVEPEEEEEEEEDEDEDEDASEPEDDSEEVAAQTAVVEHQQRPQRKAPIGRKVKKSDDSRGIRFVNVLTAEITTTSDNTGKATSAGDEQNEDADATSAGDVQIDVGTRSCPVAEMTSILAPTEEEEKLRRLSEALAESTRQQENIRLEIVALQKEYAIMSTTATVSSSQELPLMTESLIEELEVVCCRLEDDSRWASFFDSGSELTLTQESDVRPEWRRFRQTDRTRIGGVAKGNVLSVEAVEIPIQWRSGSKKMHYITAAIVPDGTIPEGINLLIGLRDQKIMDANIQPAQGRIILHAHSHTEAIVLHTQKLSKLSEILLEQPLRYLAICGGLCGEYNWLRDLGYNFEYFHAIEWDEDTRNVARAQSDGFIQFLAPHNLRKINAKLSHTYTDIGATPECAPWSQLRLGEDVKRRGFNDTRSDLFLLSCAIIHDQLGRNPDLNVFYENVVVARDLRGDADKQDATLGIQFEVVEAAKLGSLSKRPRRIASNMAKAADLQLRSPPHSSIVVTPGWNAVIEPMHCIVSKIKTKHPAEFRNAKTGEIRVCTAEEREVYMGHVRGITSEGRTIDGDVYAVEEEFRRALMGKGLNQAHVIAYFSHRKCGMPHSERAVRSFWAESDTKPDDEQLEKLLSSFDTQKEVEQWLCQHTMKEFKQLELQLHMREGTGSVQVMHSYNQGGKHDASMDKCLEVTCAAGRLREVQYHPDQYIAPCFPKAKPGRTFPDSLIALVRLLNDLRWTNAEILDDPYFWQLLCVSREELPWAVPPGTRWFGEVDLHDAFSYGTVHKDSRKYLVIHWKGRFYEWIGVPQGLKPASLYFNAMMVDLLNRALGLVWRKWFMGYMDDWTPMAQTEERCKLRQRILLAILAVAKLPVSPKCKHVVSEAGLLIGMLWRENGICFSDDAVLSLMESLSMVPKNISEAKHIVGMVVYFSTIFEYAPGQVSKHADDMAILLESTKGTRIKWDETCNEALTRLRERAKNSPRKMYDPVILLRGNWCLVAVFDASDWGGGAALLLVKRACATRVDPNEDFKPENGAILLDVYHKVWSGTQSRYQTYEQELFMMVKYIGKRSRYLAMAIAEHQQSSNCKLGLFTDSTTAFKKWYSITVPQALLEHVSAVERRLLSWSDKIAYTELWNIYVAHIPGALNGLAHWLSHLADMVNGLMKRQASTMIISQIGGKATSAGDAQDVFDVVVDAAANRFEYETEQLGVQSLMLKHATTMVAANSNMPTEDAVTAADLSREQIAHVMGITIHSFHGPWPASGGELPNGFQIHHLNILNDQVKVIADAYGKDTGAFHQVSMSKLYEFATNPTSKSIAPLEKKHMELWIGKKVFLITPPNAEKPILYTTASDLIVRWADQSMLENVSDGLQLHRVLVPIIPAGAMVNITGIDPICDTTDPESWVCQDLRKEIILIAHGLQTPHASLSDTCQNVRKVANWFKMEIDVKKFYDQCPECILKNVQVHEISQALWGFRRFCVVIIDKLKFTKTQSEIIGAPAALIFTCPQVADSTWGIVENMTAIEAARVFLVKGITKYSVPMVVLSDSEPCFAAEVMQNLAQMFGIKQWDFGAVSRPQTHGGIEIRMKPYKAALKEYQNAGLLKSRQHAEVILAKAEIRVNQYTIRAGATAFERITGEVPRTFRDMVSSYTTADIELTDDNMDEDTVKLLQSVVQDMALWYREVRDMESRDHAYPKLSAMAQKQLTHSYIKVEDQVSYNGDDSHFNKWIVTRVHAGASGIPITADIRKVRHEKVLEQKHVSFHELTNLGTSTAKPALFDDRNFSAGNMIFYREKEDVYMGIIVTDTEKTVSVHNCEFTQGTTARYRPLWLGKDSEPYPRQKPQKKSHQPFVEIVKKTAVEATSAVEKPFYVPMAVFDELEAKGIDLNNGLKSDAATSSCVFTSFNGSSK